MDFDYMEQDNEGIHFELPEFFNKHYIRIREDSAIIHGFSDAFEQPQDGDILINDRGRRNFRLFPGGTENPPIRDELGIPLYKWENEQVQERTQKEIQAERDALPPPQPPPTTDLSKIQEQIDDLGEAFDILLEALS